MALSVVPYYAALLALLFVALSVNVIRGRRSDKVSLGIGSNADLERRVRVHANFAEYVPFALLLIAMAEIRGAPGLLIHLLCASLLIGRVAHAWGVSRAPEDFRFRVGGTAATQTTLIVASLLLLLG